MHCLLRVTMGANFQWKELEEDTTESSLLRVNGASLLLGYIRPLVAQIAGASIIGQQNIPFFNFSDNDKDEN